MGHHPTKAPWSAKDKFGKRQKQTEPAPPVLKLLEETIDSSV
jgi:hypothetical protein